MVVCLLCDRGTVDWSPYCLAHDLELWLCGWWQQGAPTRTHNMQAGSMHDSGQSHRQDGMGGPGAEVTHSYTTLDVHSGSEVDLIS